MSKRERNKAKRSDFERKRAKRSESERNTEYCLLVYFYRHLEKVYIEIHTIIKENYTTLDNKKSRFREIISREFFVGFPLLRVDCRGRDVVAVGEFLVECAVCVQ